MATNETKEPVVKAENASVPQPAAEPAPKAAAELAAEPVTEEVAKPAAEATPEPVPEPAAEPAAESSPAPAAPSLSKPPILCLGMARTGTASLGEALKILGIEKVHHGLDVAHGSQWVPQWRVLDRAADATFPSLPTYTGKPFTREEWDEAFGTYDAVTDIASFYATSLIQAYPDAKVILVERDIEKWLVSIDQAFRPVSSIWHQRYVRFVERLTGALAGTVIMKMEMGWTEAKEPKDILTNARAAYERHYKEVRASVPKDLLLDFQYADGWEPLCEFLGKPVPDVPFPHVNDAAAYKEYVNMVRKSQFKGAVKKILCFGKSS